MWVTWNSVVSNMGVITATDENVWQAGPVDVFDDLSPAMLEEITGLAQTLEVPRGEIVFSPEDEAESVYLIREGKVKLSKVADDGKEITLAILQEGDLFGELTAPETGVYGHFAEALEDAVLSVIRSVEFEDLVHRKPELALAVIHALAERMRRAELQIEDLVFRSVPARVASVLVRLAQEHGRVGARGVTIDLRLTHQEIANMVGATRETVTNVLNDLRAEGMIEIEHKRVRIVDQDALGEAAQLART